MTTMYDDDNLKKNIIEIKSFPRFHCYDKLKLDDFQCVAKEAFPNFVKKAMIVFFNNLFL